MTMLARGGVPGLVLWVLVLVSWFGMLTNVMLTARARGHEQWANLFLFIVCYVAAIVISASFNVVLEGLTQGIWFWCLFGFGVGSVMIYRARPRLSLVGQQSLSAFLELLRRVKIASRPKEYPAILPLRYQSLQCSQAHLPYSPC